MKFEWLYVHTLKCFQFSLSHAAVTQKMADQMNHQAMRLALLQKEVDDISLAVNDVRSTYSSLEGKLSEDKGREFQSFPKGKSKVK